MNINSENKPEAFYTPPVLIDAMFDMLGRLYDGEITEYLENSAGGGAIVDYFDMPYIAMDISPTREDIERADYLKKDIPYKKGRVCVMNPPFHKGMLFLKKALKECDYVVCVLSAQSILNIDCDKIHVDEIQLWRKFKFDNCEVSIILLACRKK